MRHWMRRNSMVPKGFLRYRVLTLLSKKAMSGSEIMSEISEQTNGQWKPSPGSIYPLLAWLQDNEFVIEDKGEAGVKRYSFTEKGRTFLGEQEKAQRDLKERFSHFGPGPGFMGPPWHEFLPDEVATLRKPALDLAVSLWKFHDALRVRLVKEALNEAGGVLEEAAKRIDKITKGLGDHQNR